MLIDFPIAPRHLHFLRFSGGFHAIIADIPHFLVAVALLVDMGTEGACEGEHSWLPLDPKHAAVVSIIFSCVSM